MLGLSPTFHQLAGSPFWEAVQLLEIEVSRWGAHLLLKVTLDFAVVESTLTHDICLRIEVLHRLPVISSLRSYTFCQTAGTWLLLVILDNFSHFEVCPTREFWVKEYLWNVLVGLTRCLICVLHSTYFKHRIDSDKLLLNLVRSHFSSFL